MFPMGLRTDGGQEEIRRRERLAGVGHQNESRDNSATVRYNPLCGNRGLAGLSANFRLAIDRVFTERFVHQRIEDPAFDDKRLATAIATRDRSYRLLLWIGSAIDKGLIHLSRAVHHSGGPDAATDWLRSNYDCIPEELRPPRYAIEEFAAFFSTFLTSSFDVVERPGTRGEGPAPQFGCRCDLCMRIIHAPHLQPKKLCARDKRRAEFLMFECLMELASENGLAIDEQRAAQIVSDSNTRRSAAYVAYGNWLVRRLAGETDGPAILALWRIIAWDPRGGMRRDFTLQLNDFKVAEEAIVSAIRNAK